MTWQQFRLFALDSFFALVSLAIAVPFLLILLAPFLAGR